VPDRSHLSIGEVLSLLRDEFPDVTISKIRFLESQGLVDPERTPSGYRKFYEHDVERLRWILRQQRENFLPLKVIKGRLTDQDDDDATGTGELEAQPSPGGVPDGGQLFAPAGPAMTGPGAPGTNGLVAVDAPAVGEPSLMSTAPPKAGAAHGDSIAAPSGEGLAVADPEGADPGFAVPPEIAPSEGAGQGGGPEVAVPGGSDPGVAPSVASAGPLPGGFDPSAARRGARDAAVAPTPSAAPAPDFGGPSHPPNQEAPGVGDRVAGLGAQPVADDDDQSFSLPELMARSGLDQAQVAELTGFGLIIPQGSSGGEKYYGPDSLAIATAAAGFARHGVEARHLRAWRTAAEREVSLFEQVVIPLLRQRNPQARAQAAATLSELAHLGAALREILVRRGLDEVH